MPKLADRIRAARAGGGRQLGFGRSGGPASARRSLLVAVRGDAPHGADLLVTSAEGVRAALDAGTGTIIGAETETLTADACRALADTGAAFVLTTLDGAAAGAVLSERLDYAFHVDEQADESLLRAVGSLQPTLLVLPPVHEPLSLRRVLAIRRVALNAGTPLAAPVGADAAADTLEALRDAGVAVVLLDRADAATVQAMRERISALPAPRRRRREEVNLAATPHDGEPPEEEPNE